MFNQLFFTLQTSLMNRFSASTCAFTTALVVMTLSCVMASCNKAQEHQAPATVKSQQDTHKQGTHTPRIQIPAEFWQFWSDGKAEISTYKGTQVRYNEERPCTSVLIFVSEPFNAEKQVKADAPNNDSIYTSVLKLNHVKRFQTGIYTYSLMTSVFTPLTPSTVQNSTYNATAPLKITFSGQEWCGMVFHQLNRQPDKSMRSLTRSYFETEGDTEETLQSDENTLFADDAFIAVRELLKPLPTGKKKFYHTLEHARISHRTLEEEDISIAKNEVTVRFRGRETPATEWTLSGASAEWKFIVEKQYPRRILAFQFTENGRVIEKAELQESMRLPYWKLNATTDEHYIQELGLTK